MASSDTDALREEYIGIYTSVIYLWCPWRSWVRKFDGVGTRGNGIAYDPIKTVCAGYRQLLRVSCGTWWSSKSIADHAGLLLAYQLFIVTSWKKHRKVVGRIPTDWKVNEQMAVITIQLSFANNADFPWLGNRFLERPSLHRSSSSESSMLVHDVHLSPSCQTSIERVYQSTVDLPMKYCLWRQIDGIIPHPASLEVFPQKYQHNTVNALKLWFWCNVDAK